MSIENKKTILLVEDDVVIALTEKISLEKYGYTVITASTGEKAIDTIEKMQGIDLILMDINLGSGIDGTETAEQILKNHDLPVVFLSSHTEPEIVEKTEKITSYGYVVKSSSITVLDASIKMAFKLFEAKMNSVESEEKFFAAFQTSPYAITITNPENGQFININDAFYAITGYTCEEGMSNSSIGLHLWVNEEDMNWVIRELKNGHKVAGKEFQFQKKNGEIITTLFSSELILIKGKYFILSSINDITERKRAEDALEKSERKYFSLVENASDMIVRFDTEFHHIFINSAVENQLGIPLSALLGKTLTEIGAPHEQVEFVENSLRKVIETNEPLDVEQIGQKCFQTRIVPEHDKDGNIESLLAITRDITERKRAEDAQLLSEDRLYNILNGLDGLVYVADMKTYETLFINNYGKGKWGDFTGKICWQNLQSGQTGPCNFCTNDRLLHPDGTPKGVYIWEFRNTVTGNWYECRDTAILWQDGRTVRLEIATDITARKLVEDQFRESEASLKEAQRIAHLGSYVVDLITGTWKRSEVLDELLGIDRTYERSMGGWLALVHPDDQTMMADYITNEVIGRNQAFDKEYRIIRQADQDERWIWSRASLERDTYGRAIRMPGTSMDITERKQAEDALRESEEKFRSIAENLSAVVFITDKNGTISYVSPSAFIVFGYHVEEMVDNVFGKYLFEKELPRILPIFKKAIHAGVPTKNLVTVAKRKDGSLFDSELNFSLIIKHEKIIGIIGLIINITERKHAKDAQLLSEDRLYNILNGLDGLIYVADMKTYETLFINNYGKGKWGDFTGKICWQNLQSGQTGPCNFCTNDRLLHPDGTPKGVHIWEFRNTITGNWYECRDTAIIWQDGRTVRLEIATDITARKQAEAALRESEERYRAISEYSHNAICIVDDQAKISWVNNEMLVIGGYSLEQLYNSESFVKFIAPNSLDFVVSNFYNALAGRPYAHHYSFYFIHKDGETRLCEKHMMDFKDKNGKFKLIISMIDITERKVAEEKINALLAEKELILKEVHHRIKNNMNTIEGLLHLQASTLKDPSAIAALNDAESRVHSMMVLYDKLYLSVSFNDVSVKDYFSALVDQIIGNFPNSTLVKIETHLDDFMIDANRLSSLGIIINELLTNIMKYAFTGRSAGLITVSASLKGNRVYFIIADNGNGMPKSIDFENSTGFGLKLVEMLTRQIGGSIRIERENGTRIILEFEN